MGLVTCIDFEQVTTKCSYFKKSNNSMESVWVNLILLVALKRLMMAPLL